VALAVGIYIVAPTLSMPRTTRFIDGTGPVFSGALFPVSIHYHRLRFGLGFSRSDFFRHHTEDDRA